MGTLPAELPILLVMCVLPAVLSLWLTKGQARKIRVVAFAASLVFSWIGLAVVGVVWMVKAWGKGVE